MRELIRAIRKSISESGLSRVYRLLSEHECAIITSFRGNEQPSENKANNRQLKGILLGKEYGVTSIKGFFIEDLNQPTEKSVVEDSFLVVNLRDDPSFKDIIIKLGKYYKQNSVLLKDKESDNAYLYGTSETGTDPKLGQTKDVGIFKGGEKAQIMSKVNGRDFIFESGSDFGIMVRGYVFARDIKKVLGE